MALKVGHLYGELDLETGKFDRGLADSGSKLKNFGGMVKSSTESFAKGFSAVALATAGIGTALMTTGVSYNSLQQTSRAALETILGSTEAVNEQMAKLDDFASNSPFAKQVFIQAQQQMLGFGVEVDKVIPALDAVQNAVAGIGGSNEDISRVVGTLSEMNSTGKLTGQTLSDLADLGIDAAQIIAEEMNLTSEEIKDMASSPGGIPVDEVWDPLVDGLAEKFQGTTDRIKEQWDGATDRIKAAWRDIGATLAAPFVDPTGGGMAVVWANDVADVMRALGEKLEGVVGIVVDRLGPAFARITPTLQGAVDAINSWDVRSVNDQIDTLVKYAPLIAGVSTALFALGTNSLPILSQLGFAGINPVVAGLGAMALASPVARDALKGVIDAASPLLGIARDLGAALGDTLMHALETLVPPLGDLAAGILDASIPLVGSLIPAISALLEVSEPVIDVIAGVVQWVADLPTPVLAAATAFALMMGPLKPVADGLVGVATGMVKVVQQAQVQAVLGNTNIAMGGLATASANAAPMIQRVGTALKGAFISSGIGIAIAAVTAALGAFAAKQAEVRAAADSYKQTLDEMGNATEDTTNKIIDEITRVKNENFLESIFGSGKSALERAEEIGVASDLVIGYIKGEEDATRALIAVTEEYVEANSGSRREREHAEERVRRFISSIDDERDALDMGIDAKQRGAEASSRLGDAEDGAADSTNRHTDALREQQDALLESANASIGQSKALRRQEDAQERTRRALMDLNKTTKDAEASEQDIEKARRAVEAALDDEASAHIDLLGAMERNNAEGAEMRSVTLAARDAFIESAKQMGINQQEAEALADKYGLIPEKIFTQVELETANAKWQLDEFVRTASNRVVHIRTELGTGVRTYDYTGGAGPVARADGAIQIPSYANGKMPQQAIIQSAKPGWVQWAEPETQGEAFIPLAPAKRARSLAIWEETGRRLGAFESFAEGGITSRGGSGSGIMTLAGPVELGDATVEALGRVILAGASRVSASTTDRAFAQLGRR